MNLFESYVQMLESILLERGGPSRRRKAERRAKMGSKEDVAIARNVARFGKHWDPDEKSPGGATGQRKAYPFGRKKEPEPQADKPLTSSQKGGMKRSLKSKQTKRKEGGGTKPLPLP